MSLRSSRLFEYETLALIALFLIFGKLGFSQAIVATTTPGTVPQLKDNPVEKSIGKVSFTFDCAQWGDKGLDHILEVMEKRQITGTFFMTGKFIETNEEGLKKIVAAGHEAANHSYEHDRKNSISECNRVARLYQEATGKEMAPYFRAPYLYEDKISWAHYEKNGWKEGYVSLITCDALPEFKYISDRIFLHNFRTYIRNGAYERTAIQRTPTDKGPGHVNGAAILMHIDGYRYHLLEQMVDIVQRIGYQCTTFSDAAAARDSDNWILDPDTAPASRLLFTSSDPRTKHPEPSQAPPRVVDAIPDLEKMKSARQAIESYQPKIDIENRGQFSFTFNCHHYHRTGLGTILVTLKKTQTPATFYISEQYFYQVPEAVKQILEHGHEMAYFATAANETKTLSDAHKFLKIFKEQTGQELVKLYRAPPVEGRSPIQNNYAISDWTNGYQSLYACDTETKWNSIKDGSYLAYLKIYLSTGPKQAVPIMEIPYYGTSNSDGGTIGIHPNGIRYHLLPQMIEIVRAKGYTLVPQSKIENQRL